MPETYAMKTSTPTDTDEMTVLTDLSGAIDALERGTVSAPVCIEVADGIFLEAETASEVDDLLQRARGLRLISMIAAGESVDRPSSMRLDKPALHERVEEILDALR